MKIRRKNDPSPILADEAIIALYFDRNENAICETDKKYGKYLFTIANNIVNNLQDSEECLNDTYLKTWNAIPPAKPSIFRAFLSKIVRNLAVDRYDEAKRQKRVPGQLCDSLSDFEGFLADGTDPHAALEAQEIGNMITDYLDGVSDRNLYIFMSRYYFTVPIAQIAKKIGMSESSVHKILAVMKKELREKLENGGIRI